MGLDSETVGSHEGRVIRAVAWPAFWFEISLWLHVGERKLGDYGGDKRVDGVSRQKRRAARIQWEQCKGEGFATA